MRFSVIVALAGMILLSGVVSAQQRRPTGRPGARIGPPPQNGALERLSRMTPEQRQRALDKLPPDRRERVERRLDNFNALPAEEKDRLRQEYRAFQNLPSERQDAIRRSFRQFQELPQDRRTPVRRELMRLRQMTPEERSTRIESETFKSRFNEQERQLLQDLSTAPGPGPGPKPPPEEQP